MSLYGSGEFRMPDSYYDPPEYDGCEDCPCEDPEHAETRCKTCHTACDSHETEACAEADETYECACPCHNLPPEPDEYDLARDREDDRLREERDNFYDGGY